MRIHPAVPLLLLTCAATIATARGFGTASVTPPPTARRAYSDLSDAPRPTGTPVATPGSVLPTPPSVAAVALPFGASPCDTLSSTSRHVTVDSAGLVYVAATCNGAGRVLVSQDGGSTWGAPSVVLAAACADIAIQGGTLAGHAIVSTVDAAQVCRVRTTSDAGVTWSAAVVIATGVSAHSGISLVAEGATYHASAPVNFGTTTLRTSPDRGVTWNPAVSVAQAWVYGELVHDDVADHVVLITDTPDFHLRRSLDGGLTFQPELNPPGMIHYSDWSLGGQAALYGVGQDFSYRISLGPDSSTQLLAFPGSDFEQAQVHANSAGNAIVVTSLFGAVQYRTIALGDNTWSAGTALGSGNFPSVTHCGLDGAYVVFSDGNDVQFVNVCFAGGQDCCGVALGAPPTCDPVAEASACGSVQLHANANDPDGDPLLITWSSTDCPDAVFLPNENDPDPQVTVDSACRECTFSVLVDDLTDGTCTDVVLVDFVDAVPPQIQFGLGPLALGATHVFFTDIQGSPSGGLLHGHGIAYDRSSLTLWVTDDELGDDIFEFDATQPSGSTLSALRRLNVPVSGSIEGITYDPSDDTLWYTDSSGLVHHVTKDGTHLFQFPTAGIGTTVKYGIAYDEGQLWVEDGQSHAFLYERTGLYTGTFFVHASFPTAEFGLGYDFDRNLLWTGHWSTPGTYRAYDADTGALVFTQAGVVLPAGNGQGHDISYGACRLWIATETLGQDVIYAIDLVGDVCDIQAECDAVPPAAVGVATDDCDPDVMVVFTESQQDGACVDEYELTRTWTATDDCGNDTVRTQHVLVFDATPPTLVGCPAHANADCGAVPAPAMVTATDNCDPFPVVSFVETQFAGTCPGNYSLVRSWTATDRCGLSSTCVQIVTVSDTTDPVVSCPQDTTVDCDGSGNLADFQAFLDSFTATDECGTPQTDLQVAPGIVSGFLTYQDFCDLSALQLNGSTAAIHGCTPAPCDPVNFGGQCVLRLTDGLSQGGSAFTTTPISLAADASFSTFFSFQLSDPIGIGDADGIGADGFVFVVQTVASSVGGLGGGLGYEGIPNSLGIEFDTYDNGAPDGNNGNHVGIDLNGSVSSVALANIPARLNNGAVWFAWVDYDGASDALEVRLATTFARPAAATLTLGVDLVGVLGSTDAFLGFTSGTGAGGNDHDIRSWVVNTSFNPIGCSGTGAQTVTFTATDACGNQAACVRTFSIVDTVAPVITGPASLAACYPTAAEAAAAAVAVATGSDSCDPSVSFSAVVVGTCDAIVTLTATDDCGNSSSVDLPTRIDSDAPVVTCPADVSLQCAGDLPAADATTVVVSDSCPGTVLVEHVGDSLVDQGCVDHFTVLRTYRATDGCGNSTDCVQSLVVSDTTPPLPVAALVPLPPAPPVSAASALPPQAAGSACSPPTSGAFVVTCAATDNCDPDPSVAARLLVTNHDVPVGGGPCVPRIDVIDVACGEVVEIRLVAPPCRARPPRSPQQAESVTSEGVRVLTGESVVLEVTATDRCGNAGAATWDPATQPAPGCDEMLPDGTCCPDLAPPAPAHCPTSPCATFP